MRNFKFRAWIARKSLMGEVGTIDFLEERVQVGSFEYKMENVKLMQWTGLVDRNGKEIYEGDILVCPKYYENREMDSNPDQYAGSVIFEEGAWQFSEGGYLHSEHESYDGNIEIIGNVHENPELMGGV